MAVLREGSSSQKLGRAGSLTRLISAWGLIFCVTAPLWLLAQENPTEFQVKAAFLFNFAKFVEWPVQKLPPNAPLIIGVLGDDPFGTDLDKTVQNKSVAGHSIETRRFGTPAEARAAHVLFIGESERRRLSQILPALNGANVLTVSDIDSFCDKGGIINFRLISEKVRFEVSPRTAEEQGLKISSRLLTVASKVK
jgi:hypothetical protein